MFSIYRIGKILENSLGSGQANQSYKGISKAAELDEAVIKVIGDHTMMVDAAQDLLN